MSDTSPLYTWRMTSERMAMLARLLARHHDCISRVSDGSLAGDQAMCLLNDLRSQCHRNGLPDPMPSASYAMHFPDTCVPEWPDRRETTATINQAAKAVLP